MFYLDDNYRPNKRIFDKVEELTLLPEKTQTRKIVDILKNALEADDREVLYYKVKFSQKRVLYQILKDDKLSKNIQLIDFFKDITERFLVDLNNIGEDKISVLKKAYKNFLDLIIVKSLELKNQNENRQTQNQNYGSNRSSYWGGKRGGF